MITVKYICSSCSTEYSYECGVCCSGHDKNSKIEVDEEKLKQLSLKELNYIKKRIESIIELGDD